MLFEWCDATKKETMKTTEFASSNLIYSVIVVYGHTSIWGSFSIFLIWGDLHIYLVQQEWKNFSANYTIIFISHSFGNEFCWSMYPVWPIATHIYKIRQQKEHQELSYCTWDMALRQLASLDCSCHFLQQFLSKQKFFQNSIPQTLEQGYLQSSFQDLLQPWQSCR